ncbi:copper-sensing histidine kinase CrdS [Caminibacter profundus]
MLAEKKALRRFLLIYIISTILLVGIGEWFYYKFSYKNIIESEIKSIETEIKFFLEQNRGMIIKIINSEFTYSTNLKIAIYKNKKLIYSNFHPKKVYFDKKFWIEDNHIYYRYEMIKMWGRIDIVAQKLLNKEKFDSLHRALLIFNIFFLFFLIFISFWLGRVFLAPMKEVIKSLEDFIRDSTHEMNTPISVILTNIEIIKEKPNKKAIKRIENASMRLSKIFEDLKYIRLYHKKKKELKKIDLKELISRRILVFETQIENKNLKVVKNCENFEVVFDEEDLIRIIDNLLSNAIKYAPNNSTIEIKLKKGKFCIKNIGEIKNIENITKKFVREERSEGGFGLGLYIVKKIADEYKIKFEIRNIDKKVETCLYFV